MTPDETQTRLVEAHITLACLPRQERYSPIGYPHSSALAAVLNAKIPKIQTVQMPMSCNDMAEWGDDEDEFEQAADQPDDDPRVVASPADIDLMDEAFNWVSTLVPTVLERRLLLDRTNVDRGSADIRPAYSWDEIARRNGITKTTAFRKYDLALAALAAKITALQVKGKAARKQPARQDAYAPFVHPYERAKHV